MPTAKALCHSASNAEQPKVDLGFQAVATCCGAEAQSSEVQSPKKAQQKPAADYHSTAGWATPTGGCDSCSCVPAFLQKHGVEYSTQLNKTCTARVHPVRIASTRQQQQ